MRDHLSTTSTKTDWNGLADRSGNMSLLPWDLMQLPNYNSALQVDVEYADRLESRTFWRRYVARNLPCLVKGAVSQWPAFHQWADPEYLQSKVGDIEVVGHCYPRLEAFGLRSKGHDVAATQLNRDRQLGAHRVKEWLPRLRNADLEMLFIELRPACAAARILENDLGAAGGRFPFLPVPPRPRFGLYSGWAAMLYKNSYSDWHFHPATDAMMCQVVGTKDVALLPPTPLSWQQIVPVHISQGRTYDVDLAKTPAYRDLRPYHVIVEPGDGLFLPVNWWHAVQARPREFGITVPVTWDSPYRDLRQPATRHFLHVLWKSNKRRTVTVFAETVYSTLINQVRDVFAPTV